MVACGGNGSDGDAQDSPWDDPQMRQMIEQASEFQREILADGEVTDAEYERAMLATASCMEDQGIDVELRTDPDGTLQVTYGGVETLEELDEMYAVHDECADEYSAVVNMIWQHENRPSVEEQMEAMEACLRQAGVDLGDRDPITVREELLQTDPERFFEVRECETQQ